MSSTDPPIRDELSGQRVAFLGRLASMSRREAASLLRQHGAVVVDSPDATIDLLVLGEQDLSWTKSPDWDEYLHRDVQAELEAGRLEAVTETELWRRLGWVEDEKDVRRLYTPAMLAELVGVPVAVVRRWHRRGLINPVREVRRLPYFDYREVTTARRLAELLASGMSPATLEKKLAALARFVPDVQRSLAQLSVIVQGREILLRQGEGLVDARGQMRFDFEQAERRPGQQQAPDESAEPAKPAAENEPEVISLGDFLSENVPETAARDKAAELVDKALELEDYGQLAEAADMYRAALAASGLSAAICFQLAEVLYRLGDLAGARERYLAALEIDEDFVEARANLGCVLAELGDLELAAAAFRGALAFHPEYADAHYLLANTLTDLGRVEEARPHWQRFLALAPESPWAERARDELGISDNQ